MRFVRFAAFIVLISAACLVIGQTDIESPTVSGADTVRGDSLPIWPDTSFAFDDSTAVPSFYRDWLVPVTVMAATGVVFVLLYSVRSR